MDHVLWHAGLEWGLSSRIFHARLLVFCGVSVSSWIGRSMLLCKLMMMTDHFDCDLNNNLLLVNQSLAPAIISDLYHKNERSKFLAMYYFTVPVGRYSS